MLLMCLGKHFYRNRINQFNKLDTDRNMYVILLEAQRDDIHHLYPCILKTHLETF